MNLVRLVRLIVLATVVAACGSGLSSGAWVWCKENMPAVDAAADGLGIPEAQTTFQEPSWWQGYLTSTLNRNNAELVANADFLASCTVAADKRGVDPGSRTSWCTADGVGDLWDASITLGPMVDVQAETFAYKALPLQQRIDNQDFVRACRTAHGS